MKEFTIFNRPFEFLTNDSQWIKLHNYLDLYLFNSVWGQYAVVILMVVCLGFLLSFVFHGKVRKAVNIFTFLIYAGVLVILFLINRQTARGFRLFDISNYLTESGFHETRVLIAAINCFFFVPFGILLRKASGRGHAVLNVLLVTCAAVGIEIGQYVLARGYTAAEDVLVYIVGGFVGLILAAPFCLVSEYLEDRRRREKQERYRSSWESRKQDRYDRYNRDYDDE